MKRLGPLGVAGAGGDVEDAHPGRDAACRNEPWSERQQERLDAGGGEDGRGDIAEAGDGGEAVVVGKLPIGGNEQGFEAFLPGAGVADLADLIADQFVGDGPVQRADGVPRV